ncbi:hypothetical protein [Rothia nasimurium]|uniref:hypothetical protein n=1 Tax=Rothia nasimurium TaxID=85336 RepID=UPI001F3F424A|nr:hypothetical protein [Rothia nasimurium]
MSTEPTPGRVIQVGKFYTAARKFKQLIGQLPDGSTIPGGPYTITQFVPTLFLLIPYALKIKFFGWGSMTAAVVETLIVLGLCALSVFALGQLPPTRRSIFHILTTYPNLVFSSKNGYWNGQKIKNHKLPEHFRTPENPAPEEPKNHQTTTKTTQKTAKTRRPTSGFTCFQQSLK